MAGPDSILRLLVFSLAWPVILILAGPIGTAEAAGCHGAERPELGLSAFLFEESFFLFEPGIGSSDPRPDVRSLPCPDESAGFGPRLKLPHPVLPGIVPRRTTPASKEPPPVGGDDLRDQTPIASLLERPPRAFPSA